MNTHAAGCWKAVLLLGIPSSRREKDKREAFLLVDERESEIVLYRIFITLQC